MGRPSFVPGSLRGPSRPWGSGRCSVPAAFALNMFPGPNNVLAMTHAARFGFATGAFRRASGGFALAFFVLTAAVGPARCFATSAELFAALKIVGAAPSDLAFRRADDALKHRAAARPRRGGRTDRHAGGARVLTAATNPKAMLVFTAFFASSSIRWRGHSFVRFCARGVALGLEFVAVVLYATAGDPCRPLPRAARAVCLSSSGSRRGAGGRQSVSSLPSGEPLISSRL